MPQRQCQWCGKLGSRFCDDPESELYEEFPEGPHDDGSACVCTHVSADDLQSALRVCGRYFCHSRMQWVCPFCRTDEKVEKRVRHVVDAVVELVQTKLIAQWGSLQDCCTDANQMINDMLKDGVDIGPSVIFPRVVRMQGYVTVAFEGQSYEILHEWLEIDGEQIDATRSQFDEYDSVVYHGDVAEWQAIAKASR